MAFQKYKRIAHYNVPGNWHELTFSCFRGYPLLSKDRACQWLMDAIVNTCRKLNYSLVAYVFMPNHVHLIMKPRDETHDIAAFLTSVKLSVSKKAKLWLEKKDRAWLKKLTVSEAVGRKTFRFWQPGAGYDRNITDENTLVQMIDYIHNNPARKGLVAEPSQWKWSSAGFYATNDEMNLLDVDLSQIA
jgi:putative transposase